MQWLVDLFRADSVAHAVLVLSLVAVLGLAIGTVKVKGIGLGIAGVLFSGLAFGHFGFRLNPHVLEFCREFGLILFVYTIGMQVGPGFFGSLRKNGLPLNLMAATIVILGSLVTIGVWKLGGLPLPAAVGLYSGATTNTPSLAASQQALKDVYARNTAPTESPTTPAPAPTTVPQASDHGYDASLDPRLQLPGMAYAIAYPFGIIGIIVTMLVIRRFFRVDLAAENELILKLNSAGRSKLETMNLEVKNPNLHGKRIEEIPTIHISGVVISRMLRAGRPEVASGESVLQAGDVLLAVGPRKGLEDLRTIVGAESPVDVRAVPSDIASRRVLVTRSAAVGKTLDELGLRDRFGANVTRVHRAEIEIPVTPDLRLQFGDNLVVVGARASLDAVAKELGDSVKQLNHPQVIPIFVGIALGVILGSWPFDVGMSAPVRLGMAGGPLLVAILLSRLGRIGPLVWYMPISANFMLREVGIVLFLACVGLNGGGKFVDTLLHQGIQWMFYGALITLVPLLLVGFVGRMIYKVNYLNLCGLLAGSMTDPPALAFAGAVTGSEAPSIAYATVYPLTMILRVVTAQMIVMLFAT